MNAKILLVVALSVVAASSRAQETAPPIPGAHIVAGRLNSQLVAVSPNEALGEVIDIQSGSLSFNHTDLKLEGQGPLIRISRSWSVASNLQMRWQENPGDMEDWRLDIASVDSVVMPDAQANADWRGRDNSYNRCTEFGVPWDSGSWWAGADMNIPEYGTQVLLRRLPGFVAAPQGQPANYPIVTNQHWAIGCLPTIKNGVPGQGFVARSPGGLRYYFDWYTRERIPVETIVTNLVQPWGVEPYPVFYFRKAKILASRVEDRFGNYVDYNYDGSNLSSIEASDGRLVLFEYELAFAGNTKRLKSISYRKSQGEMLKIQYGYHSSSYNYLRSVTYPDGSAWRMDLGGLNRICDFAQEANEYGCHDYPYSTTALAIMRVGTLTSPSGVSGHYKIGYSASLRVSQDCLGDGGFGNSSCPTHPLDPGISPSFPIKERKIYGPGLPEQGYQWTYRYSQGPISYTYVTKPDDMVDVYKYGNEGMLSQNERKLLALYEGSVLDASGGVVSAARTTLYTHATGVRVGVAPQSHVNRLVSEYTRNTVVTNISQDGINFGAAAENMDGLGRYLRFTRSNSTGQSRIENITYADDFSEWVIGQLSTKSIDGIEREKIEYGWKALPWKNFIHGKLLSTLTYDNTSSVESGQLGTLKSFVDANGNATSFSSWKRGIPRVVGRADATGTLSEVNDAGWIASTTNEDGAKTCYGYDAMGRVNLITYSSESQTGACDEAESDWLATRIEFRPMTAGEWRPPGIEAGQWRQYTSTGNYQKVIYFDALWRPVLSHEYDAANTSGTLRAISTSYDAAGRVAFQSYPSSDLIPAATGIWTFYDALDRIKQVKQDSEQGQLTTTTEYLSSPSGPQIRVTKPNGEQTLTTYQAFDQPTYDYPTMIAEPMGRTTVIPRDVFGKPVEIERK